MNTRRAGRWLTAAMLACLGLAATPAAGLAMPAVGGVAAVDSVGQIADPNPALINPAATCSLTIHKVLGAGLDPAAYPADGGELTLPPSATPLPGVVFTIAQVQGVDLTTNAGWAAALAYSGDIAAARANLGPATTLAPTGPDGRVVAAGLPIGLYLVHEVGLPTTGGGVDPALSPVADFLVTLPMTNPDTRASWLYDVHVYPKNSRSTITKTVADGNLGVDSQDAPVAGRVLTYTLAADIPGGGLRAFGGQCVRDGRVDTGPGRDAAGFTATGMCASGATYVGVAAGAAYRIIDDLATMPVPGSNPPRTTADYLEFVAADWTGTVGVVLEGAAVTTLVATTAGAPGAGDYILTQEPSRIVVELTDRGLAALAAAEALDPATRVVVTVQARVRAEVVEATTQSTGVLHGAQVGFVLRLPNRAVLVPSGTTTGQVVSGTVVTVFATLVVRKTDAANSSPVRGAVFTLYRTREDALVRRNPLAVSAPTDAAGMTQIPGLHATDYQNDAFDTDSYWLVESTVPEGYVGTTDPIQVRILQDGTTVAADGSVGVTVLNRRGEQPPPPPPPDLPHTGAELASQLAVAGFLILGGIVLAVLARRRADEHEADR